MLVFSAIALASATPAPFHVHGDWIAGCDNGLRREAVLLQPDPGAETLPIADGELLVSIVRGPLPDLPLRVNIRLRDGDRATFALSLDDLAATMAEQTSRSTHPSGAINWAACSKKANRRD